MRNNIALMHVVHCQSLHLTHDDSSWWTMRIKLKSCFDLHWHYPVCALQWRHAPHWLFISGEPPIFHFFFTYYLYVSFGKISIFVDCVSACTIISNMLYNLLSQAASMRIIQLFWWNAFANLSNNCTQRTHWLFFAQIFNKTFDNLVSYSHFIIRLSLLFLYYFSTYNSLQESVPLE